MFHEQLHRGYLGGVEPRRIGESEAKYLAREEDTEAYYKYKNNQILKPKEDVQEEDLSTWEYVSKPEESAANLFECGKRAGLQPGAEYPGDAEFDRIVEKIINDTKWTDRKNVLKVYDTANQKKNIWKALTGTYFSLIPLGITYGKSQGQTN